jgi:hypothetical protein
MLAALLTTTLVRSAIAEPPSTQEIATAEALFRDGKRLMGAGNYPGACPKLAESQRLDPGGGTLLTLALCHEGEGRTASAWAEFGEALTLALKDGRVDRATVAREHGERLEPKLSRLTVKVPASVASLAGVEIRRDGSVLGTPAWGTAVPVDPGEHLLEATAPGKRKWSRWILIAPASAAQTVEVKDLEDETPAKTPPPSEPKTEPKTAPEAKTAPEPTAPEPTSSSRTAALAIAGVGVGFTGAATYFGLKAFADRKSAKDRCPGSTCGDREAVDLNESSGREADLSTAGFVLGGAALGAAAVLWFTSGSPNAGSPRAGSLLVAPLCGAREIGGVVSARF